MEIKLNVFISTILFVFSFLLFNIGEPGRKKKTGGPWATLLKWKKNTLAINKLDQKSLMYYLPFEDSVASHFKKLESLPQGCFMLCLDWIALEKTRHFHSIAIISPWKMVCPSRFLYPGMLRANYDRLKLASGSGEEYVVLISIWLKSDLCFAPKFW